MKLLPSLPPSISLSLPSLLSLILPPRYYPFVLLSNNRNFWKLPWAISWLGPHPPGRTWSGRTRMRKPSVVLSLENTLVNRYLFIWTTMPSIPVQRYSPILLVEKSPNQKKTIPVMKEERQKQWTNTTIGPARVLSLLSPHRSNMTLTLNFSITPHLSLFSLSYNKLVFNTGFRFSTATTYMELADMAVYSSKIWKGVKNKDLIFNFLVEIWEGIRIKFTKLP